MKRFLALSLVCLFAASFASTSAAQVTEHSPAGKMLVVSANLQEAWGDESGNNSEMDKSRGC